MIARLGPALRRHGAPLLAYVALAVALTWPLALHLGSLVPHDLGDPVSFVWIFWWNAHHLPLTAGWLNPPIFYPSPGAILFQDSMLGVWPFTSAVQWLGGSPILAYNLLLLGSFAASAFAAYLLCVRLVADRRAAFAGGLAFGFALYRMGQLAHMHILLSFWIPLILLGLHAYLETRRWRWLAVAAACWAMQALTSGYFLVYSSVLVGLWVVFFLRWRVWDTAKLTATFGVALASIWPWISLYRSMHEQYGFRRSVGEADYWAADVTSLIRAPEILAVWGRWIGDTTKEAQLFPGLTLALACVVIVARSHYWAKPRWSAVTIGFLAVAGVFGIVAAVAATAPTSFDLAGVHVSLGRPYKPLSWVWLALLLALLTSPPVRRVLRDRSVAGFYGLAALALWILTLGPTVRFMGERIWYKAPFSWLLVVPGSDAVRVPARFWLLAVLALGVVVAHGLARLRRHPPVVAWTVIGIVCAGLVSEAWLARLPLLEPPARVAALDARADSSPVLELPMDDAFQNVGAMYRATIHQAPLVNGFSGYEPASFISLRVGLKEGDPAALVPYSERMPLDIVIHTQSKDAELYDAVVRAAGAALVTEGDGVRLYHLPERPPIIEPAPSDQATVSAVTEEGRGDVTRLLTDDDPFTFVETQEIRVTLATSCRVNEVGLAVNPGVVRLTVRGGPDGASQELWRGRAAERNVRAALADPRTPRLRLRFSPAEIDGLQIVLEVPPGEQPPAIQGVRVYGEGCR